MRGLLVGAVFFGALPFVFIRGPFVGILLWFWVSLMAPQFIIYGFFARVGYAWIAAVATLASWLFFSNEQKYPPRDKLTVLLALFMVWFAITSALGTAPPDLAYQWTLLIEKMLLMTLVGYTLANTRERINQLIAVCAFSIAFYGIKGGLFSLLTGGHFRVLGPQGSMIGDNNLLGLALCMVLPLLAYLRQLLREAALRGAMLAVIGLTTIGAVFTYSRGAFLALGVMGAVAWFRSRYKFVSAVLVIAIVGGIWQFAPPALFHREDSIASYEQDSSAMSRLYMWRLSWAMFLRHPVFGSGVRWSYNVSNVNTQLAGEDFHWPFKGKGFELPQPGSGADAQTEVDLNGALDHAMVSHSIWFETLSDLGLPGFVLFVTILLTGFLDVRWLRRHANSRTDLRWAADVGRYLESTLVAYAVAGTFVSAQLYDGFYAIVMIAAAARRVAAGELGKSAAAKPAKTIPAATPALPRDFIGPRPAK